MRSKNHKIRKISKSEAIIKNIENLPYFSIDNFAFEKDRNYLKVTLSRLARRKKIIPLKRGFYVSRQYLDNLEKKNLFNDYLEFITNILYSPSYLSLEYVLSEYNILSESSYNFTAITKNKTNKFKNEFGIFGYHHLKDELFNGFDIIENNDFLIYKATKVKALFDFLYLRKNILINKEIIDALRLNLDNFNKKDIIEFKKFVILENSKKMKQIFISLFKERV